MAGAVPAAAGAAAAAASTGMAIARPLFSFLFGSLFRSAATTAAAGYGLHALTSNEKGESWFGKKTSELFNWLVEKGKNVGEQGFEMLWDNAKKHPVIAGLIAVGGFAMATGNLQSLLMPALVGGGLYMAYKYFFKDTFNANAEGSPDTPAASYRQKLTQKLEIPAIQLRGLAVAGGAPELHNDK